MSLDQYVVKTHGRLPTDFGQEIHTNIFHGGTILRDAKSKYIHVPYQVSLGAGETINSKLAFENGLGKLQRLG